MNSAGASFKDYRREHLSGFKIITGMKLNKFFLCRLGRRWMVLILALYSGPTLNAATSSFSFTLDEPCKTSAGVFLSDGTLVRTLWSKVHYYSAGTYSNTWDGMDDNSNAVAPGVYQIKVLQNNVDYVWDGAMGNTSTELSGSTIHTGFYPMRDMAIAGTNAFYVTGYNEGKCDFCNFATTDPQRVKMKWTWCYNAQFNLVESDSADVYDRNWSWTVTDGSWVYFACSSANNPTNLNANAYPGFIMACNVSDNSPAYFTTGIKIPNGPGPNEVYPNGIYVGTQPGLSGLAVQKNGNLLAASVAPDNCVYLFDKRSGSAIGNFSVNSPGRLSFSPDGSLWVISSNTIICYTNLSSHPSIASTISNLAEPLDVAVHPTNANIILVADGGSSEQVKAFNGMGTSLWTYGLAGGYASNGVAVATNKFWFFDGESDGTFLCFAADGSFWVGDGANHRTMHFSMPGNYIEQIMSQPYSYMDCVDQNNPTRVFNQFLEFQVDYTKPLSQSWTLINNWKVGVGPNFLPWNQGLFEVTTFPNGRTYGLIHTNYFDLSALVELGTNGLRFTGIFPIAGYPLVPGSDFRWISLGADGSARATTVGSARWYQRTLNGFDANGNPLWNPEALIASASEGNTDPVPRGGGSGNVRTTISTNNILIAFDQSLNNGWHLGGIKVGTTNWLWKAAPAATWLNGMGNYEIANGVTYAGNTVQAIDRNVFYGYHGEFFRGEGQAGQNMHFYDDGLFVGQFGEASPGHSAYEAPFPGFAGNGHFPTFVKSASGDYYMWINDESEHGLQRWHLVNTRNIREQTGSGTLGSAILLTNPVVSFPTGVIGKPGNQSVEISWRSVANATSYNIRYSFINGGPFQTLVAQTAGTNYIISGLTNGQTYYFAITAVSAGIEGIPSEQVDVRPFDTSQTVLCAGQISEGGQFTPIIDVSSTAADLGQPTYVGAEQMTGVLNLREIAYYGYGDLMDELVGTKGYVIYDWGGIGSNVMHVLPPFAITVGSGWTHTQYLERQYKVDNTLGFNYGYAANPSGLINIGVSDTNFHFLTVISPARSNEGRTFTMALTSTNNTSVKYVVNESPGYSHTYQFLFKGNVTLSVDATGGQDGIVQALFLDDASVAAVKHTLNPPTQLHVVIP